MVYFALFLIRIVIQMSNVINGKYIEVSQCFFNVPVIMKVEYILDNDTSNNPSVYLKGC